MSERRLHSRIQEVVAHADLKTADRVSEQLRSRFPEYNRRDRAELKRLIQVELDRSRGEKAGGGSGAGAGGPQTTSSAGGATSSSSGFVGGGTTSGQTNKGSSSKKRPPASSQDSQREREHDDQDQVGVLGVDNVPDQPQATAATASGGKRRKVRSEREKTNAGGTMNINNSSSNRSLQQLYSRDQQQPQQQQAPVGTGGGGIGTSGRRGAAGGGIGQQHTRGGGPSSSSGGELASAIGSVIRGTAAGAPSSNAAGGGPQGRAELDASQFEVVETEVSLESLGGIDGLQKEIRDLVLYPLQHSCVYRHLGAEPPTGVLLHGPPGSGKTILARATCGTLHKLGVACFRVNAPEIVSSMSGDSEAKLRSLFNAAIERAPCLLFFDEIDAITPKRDGGDGQMRQMDRRIVSQLLSCLDSLQGHDVLVLAATSRPENIDTGLRRAGRFDREIAMGIPDLNAREAMLRAMTRDMRLCGETVSLRELAEVTPGYVGADLMALTQEAALHAVQKFLVEQQRERMLKTGEVGQDDLELTKVEEGATAGGTSAAGSGEDDEEDVDVDENENVVKAGKQAKVVGRSLSSSSFSSADEKEEDKITKSSISTTLDERLPPLDADQFQHLSITGADFVVARQKVQPSAQREGFATAPNVSFEDVGALKQVREEMDLAIIQPIKRQALFEKLGLSSPAGVLLFGPPGCGKTLLAKAVASAANANFISVKGPELLNKYVGESERAVRSVFQRAQTSAPCIVFFDELDSLTPKRSSDSNSGQERVVNQMLTELDGMERRRDVFIIAATNRPDIIDPAMLRPGRLDRLLYVPLPDEEGRADILERLVRKSPVSKEVDFQKLAKQTEGFTGADLGALCREATIRALKEMIAQEVKNEEEMKGAGAGGEATRSGGGTGDCEDEKQKHGGDETTSGAADTSAAVAILVQHDHFEQARTKVSPSVTAKQQEQYLNLAKKVQSEKAF